jgi:hypothetical protein
MAGKKYEKLFVSGVPPAVQAKRSGAAIGFINGKTFEGCNDYNIYWIIDKPAGAYGTKAWGEVSHGPQTHKYPELLVHLGTDPDNPMDLGAEIEMCMGPELEKYIFNKSTIICIPANFVHAPWRIVKVTRPFLMIEINQSTIRTEKSRKDLVSAEDLKRMLFVDVGYDSDEMVMHWPEAAGPRPDVIEPIK